MGYQYIYPYNGNTMHPGASLASVEVFWNLKQVTNFRLTSQFVFQSASRSDHLMVVASANRGHQSCQTHKPSWQKLFWLSRSHRKYCVTFTLNCRDFNIGISQLFLLFPEIFCQISLVFLHNLIVTSQEIFSVRFLKCKILL